MTVVEEEISLETLHWLAEEEGQKALDEFALKDDSSPRLAQELARRYSAERARAILGQVSLRKRAQEKFPFAAKMLFTRVGLEQATDYWVARHKARRFANRDDAPLFDLCCGIGGDLSALAQAGFVMGWDRRPSIAWIARWNAEIARTATRSSNDAFVVAADVTLAQVGRAAAWHIDPDRRVQGRRSTNVIHHEPNEAAIERLLEDNPRAAIKLAPAASIPETWAARAEGEWISSDGECRQLVAWFGDLADAAGQRRATILRRGSAISGDIDASGKQVQPRSIVGLPTPIEVTDRIGHFIHEPDSAVLAARLSGLLAAEHGLGAISPNSAYLTGDSPFRDLALASFEALVTMPFDLKKVKAELRARRWGRLEIKQRGARLDPEIIRRRLRTSGDEAGTLIVTPLGKRMMAILARRVDHQAIA